MKLWRRFRIWLMRHRLAAIYNDIEVIERGRIISGQDLDRLMRIASNLRADLWFAENARTSGGNLRSLSSPLVRRAELRRYAGGAR